MFKKHCEKKSGKRVYALVLFMNVAHKLNKMMRFLNIRGLETRDWPDVKRIYLQGIATGCATFQTGSPDWHDWDNSHLKCSRLVAVNSGQVLGWAALSPVSNRSVYAGVAEVSIYIAENFRGQKVGYDLLQHLISESEENNIWTLQAGIFPQNAGSVRLHEKAGFRIIGHREKIGQLKGVWHDNLLLERRSKVVGV
jgi:L-amino acid N-acyltransferase YncA